MRSRSGLAEPIGDDGDAHGLFLAAALAALTCRGWLGPVLGGLGFGLACALPAKHARGSRADRSWPHFSPNRVNFGSD